MATHSSVLAWRIPTDRGARWATVHGVAKSQTRLKRQHTRTHTHAPNLRTHISLGPENPFLGIYLIQMLKKYTEIIAVVLVVRKDQKHEYKKNIQHIHTMECYITSKIRDEMTFDTVK